MTNLRNTLRLATGGQSSRDAADLQMHTVPAFWLSAAAGGPLDAPIALPAGSCNSTEWRTGPWHLTGGTGRYAPAQSSAAREGSVGVHQAVAEVA